MLDWFVLLTPLILLPIFLLLVFVGCAGILGIEEGVLQTEDDPVYPNVTFTYAANLPGPPPGQGIQSIQWSFVTTDLIYSGQGGIPPAFDPGDHLRGQGSPDPILEDGESVDHGSIGSPIDGILECRCRVKVFGEANFRILDPASKGPNDIGFPEFQLSNDLLLT